MYSTIHSIPPLYTQMYTVYFIGDIISVLNESAILRSYNK